MNNNFLSLRAFASESLGLPMKPNQSDIEMSMQLGENYSRVFAKKLNTNFNVQRFECRDNGIIRSIHCITENGQVEIQLQQNVLENSTTVTSIIKENNESYVNESTFSLFPEFAEAIDTILRKCDKTV